MVRVEEFPHFGGVDFGEAVVGFVGIFEGNMEDKDILLAILLAGKNID